MSDEIVAIHKSKLTALGNSVRSRFGLTGELTLDEMAEIVMPSLPSGYTAVEYLQSSGTQYINTDFTPSYDFEINVDLEMPPVTAQSDFYLFGSTKTNSNAAYALGGYNSLYHTEYGTTAAHFFTSASFSGKSHINYHNGLISITDGTTTLSADLSAQAHTTSTLPFYIFCNYNSDIGAQGKASFKLYNFAIKSYGITVRYFVPCIRNSDSVAGLYDLIYGQFYTNAGTGTFIVPT